MGPEFFQTGMGRKFYESDVPRIAKSLEKIGESLEQIATDLKVLSEEVKRNNEERGIL